MILSPGPHLPDFLAIASKTVGKPLEQIMCYFPSSLMGSFRHLKEKETEVLTQGLLDSSVSLV